MNEANMSVLAILNQFFNIYKNILHGCVIAEHPKTRLIISDYLTVDDIVDDQGTWSIFSTLYLC